MNRNALSQNTNSVVDLFATMATFENATTMKRFCAEILTPKELHDLDLRWRCMQKLAAGTPQRTIASDLGVSLCKITRGARILKDPHSIASSILSKEKI